MPYAVGVWLACGAFLLVVHLPYPPN